VLNIKPIEKRISEIFLRWYSSIVHFNKDIIFASIAMKPVIR
jgi:hypothetical protein